MTQDTLTVVIPAYNEEEAIGDTVRRCLEARKEIKNKAQLNDVEIIVVSDGSVDNTVNIAKRFRDVKVIVFEKNRGYGAAIKEGFRQGKGSLVSFLDADGTCDPLEFSKLCNALQENRADIVLGSRMGKETKMPRIRKVGNYFYALLLGFLCGHRVTDTASGMRVIRRSALRWLYPLPDGLHFTPSMSARALLNGLSVIEVPIPYEERIGESKLNVIKDGIRFLKTILAGVLCYRPERIFLMGFSVCLAVSVALAIYPVEFYFENRWIKEWMIYRFLACFLLGSAGFLLLCATTLSYHLSFFGPRQSGQAAFWPAFVASFFEGKPLAVFTFIASAASLALVWPGLVEYATTSHVNLHWSRVMVASFLLLLTCQANVTHVLVRVLKIWQFQSSNQEEIAHSHASVRVGTRRLAKQGLSHSN